MRARFSQYLNQSSYVGEVGLDFSREGLPSRVEQVASYRQVLELVRTRPRFLSVHSRRAESAVLDLLREMGTRPVVFHWFTGSLAQVDRLLEMGHACSVNAAMVRSPKERAIIERVPPDRLLTETDGLYLAVRGRRAQPGEVGEVVAFLRSVWATTAEEAYLRLARNFRALLPAQGSTSG